MTLLVSDSPCNLVGRASGRQIAADEIHLRRAVIERLGRGFPDVVVAEHLDAGERRDHRPGLYGRDVDALRVALPGHEDSEAGITRLAITVAVSMPPAFVAVSVKVAPPYR